VHDLIRCTTPPLTESRSTPAFSKVRADNITYETRINCRLKDHGIDETRAVIKETQARTILPLRIRWAWTTSRGMAISKIWTVGELGVLLLLKAVTIQGWTEFAMVFFLNLLKAPFAIERSNAT
jgi:hypothetical protein